MKTLLGHPLAVAVLSTFILKASDLLWEHIGSGEFAMIVWQKFFIEMWPIWCGLLIGACYWCVRFLLRINRMAERSLRLSASLVERINRDDSR
jgi:MFS superfamily sulfate permease-like transporter